MSDQLVKEFTISSYDLNPKGQARLTSIANLFQEMAYQHANQLGFGFNDLKEKKTFWVLSRMKIRVNRFPVWDDRIRVETWHRGMERIFGMRDFRIDDVSGNTLGVASTAWLILDSETRRPVRVTEEVLHRSKREVAVFTDPLDKIVLPEDMQEVTQRRVLFSDLDIMGHVNNVKYMEWCIDAAMANEESGREVHELEINYTQEAMLGDDIQISGTIGQKDGYFFLARRNNDEKEIFRAHLTLR